MLFYLTNYLGAISKGWNIYTYYIRDAIILEMHKFCLVSLSGYIKADYMNVQ